MTALQELYTALHNTHPGEWVELIVFEKSRLLEKDRQQIIDAASEGCYEESSTQIDGEEYYNRIFGKSETLIKPIR